MYVVPFPLPIVTNWHRKVDFLIVIAIAMEEGLLKMHVHPSQIMSLNNVMQKYPNPRGARG